MTQRRQQLHTKSEPSLSSLISDSVALVQRTALHPFLALFRFVKSLVRLTVSPLIPFAILAISTPILALISFATGVYVWKSGSVSWIAQLDLQYGDGLPPYASTSLPAMSPSEPYDILLHLALPATQANYALGNFMTSLNLATANNKTIATVRKPAILLQPSTVFFSKPKTIYLTVPLLKDHVMTAARVNANLELGRKDGWKSVGTGEGREVSVLSASLEGVLKYHGIRGMVSKYPVTTAVISGWSFFVVSFMTVSLCLAPAVAWSYDIPVEDPVVVKTEVTQTAPLRRRKSVKREPTLKNEEPKIKAEDLPTASILPHETPLRRRRSQLSRDEE